MSTPPPTTPARGFGLAIVGTLVHAGLVLALLVLAVSYVPAAKKTFDEFGMTLPELTRIVVQVSNWIAEYWWTLVPVFLLFGAADFGFLLLVSARSRSTAVKLGIFLSLLLVVPIALTVTAIELPKMKLREGLAR